ncbi:2-hydroxyacid dehydrogenase [Acidisphaera sp. L21]|jgi:hydroxypyruvate reductase|uniref:2-hydroxyacid dehydrogenase n=1 Tax=Acidisphaera sp. L21 TaxID=1641851 RepID=UPI00131BCEEE|nr:2-hydroxyacid dehydrogenase [Acidisphaera sp. L21]
MPTLLQLTSLRPEIQSVLDSQFTVHHYAKLPDAAAWVTAHGAEVDAVATGGGNGIPTALMVALPNLKIVAINGVGFDKVDLEAARAQGVRVTNTPDVLTDDVADLAVGLTIGIMRRLHHAHRFVTAGHWPTKDWGLARKVSGKRFGILGMGRIGQAVARRLSGFDGTISYTDVAAKDVPYHFVPDLVQLAAGSDVLVVCAAASTATRAIVNGPVLDALGPEGALVNIARGSIVDEVALVAALQSGALGAAALDVFVDEPNVPAALLGMENVLLTPHIASATTETRRAMGMLMLDNLSSFFAGRPLPTPVV